MPYDIIIIGAGISGATLAERYANQAGKRVLLIEKRDHIGGNCYDYLNEDGILVPKYGPHFFHTNDEGVWEYVSRFTDWHPYEHRVFSDVQGKRVPVPVNIDTVNKLFGLSIKNTAEMEAWLEEEREKIDDPQNSEHSALNRVGKRLYPLMFKNYTHKQWDMWPAELDASVMDRIPVRTNFDDRYFTDVRQAMPKAGYTKIFEKMLKSPLIEVRLSTDFFAIRDELTGFEKMFYTGPIDRFFNYELQEKLQYRSLRFEHETLPREYYQEKAQVNYPHEEISFTRITEPKRATGQRHEKTTIIKEYSTWDGEPYYPVPSKRNQDLFKRYQTKAQALEMDGIHFVGRLANYKYFNMDQAFRNSLDIFTRLTTS